MATAVDTVSVSREALLEAVASLHAAAEVFIVLNDNTSPAPLGERFDDAGRMLREAAFGPEPEGDAYLTDPTDVEIWARSHEIAAAALDNLELERRINRLREIAARVRRDRQIAEPSNG